MQVVYSVVVVVCMCADDVLFVVNVSFNLPNRPVQMSKCMCKAAYTDTHTRMEIIASLFTKSVKAEASAKIHA